MLRIISEPKVETSFAYRRIFRTDYECHGFLCIEDGSPIFRNAHEAKLFDKCLTKPDKYKDCGRVRREAHIHHPAIGLCECGNRLILRKNWDNLPIKCICGRLYATDGTAVRKYRARHSMQERRKDSIMTVAEYNTKNKYNVYYGGLSRDVKPLNDFHCEPLETYDDAENFVRSLIDEFWDENPSHESEYTILAV